MTARLFVGNLNPRTTKSELSSFLSKAGRVVSVTIPSDRDTGRARGFAFVEFPDRERAEAAIESCDGRELGGHALSLSWAREREERGGTRRSSTRRRGSDLALGGGEDPTAERQVKGPRGPGRERDEDDGYGESRRPHRHGKHGSDRKRGRGTRRVID